MNNKDEIEKLDNIESLEENNNINNSVIQQVDSNNINNNVIQQLDSNNINNNVVQQVDSNNVNNSVVQQIDSNNINNNVVQQVDSNNINNNVVQQVENKKKNKGLIIIIIIIIVVVILCVLLILKVKFNSNSSKIINNSSSSINYKGTLLNSDEPILVKKNGKYSYIDNKGKFLFNTQYDDATEFINGKAIVKNGTGYYDIITKNGIIGVFEAYILDRLIYLRDYDFYVLNGFFDKNLKKVFDMYIYEYEEIGYKEGIFAVDKKGSYRLNSIVNSKGEIIYEPEELTYESFLNISKNDGFLKNTYCHVGDEKTGSNGIINCKTGKVIYELQDKYQLESLGYNLYRQTNKETKEEEIIYIYDDKIEKNLFENNVSIKENYYINKYSDKYLEITSNQSGGFSDNNKIYIDVETNKKYTENEIKQLKIDDSIIYIDNFSDKIGIYAYKDSEENMGLKKDNKIIVKAKYDEFIPLNKDLFEELKNNGKEYIIAKKNNNIYIIDIKTGKEVYCIKNRGNHYDLQESELSPFIVLMNPSRGFLVYNLFTNKEKEIPLKVTEDNYNINYRLGVNYIMIEYKNEYQYYNNNLDLIYKTK